MVAGWRAAFRVPGFDGKRNIFMTPTGSKDVETQFWQLWDPREEARPAESFLSRTWEPGGGMASARGRIQRRGIRKTSFSREQPMASGQKRRWESGFPPIFRQ